MFEKKIWELNERQYRYPAYSEMETEYSDECKTPETLQMSDADEKFNFGKKSISVREMGAILGLGKTESYLLVKKKYFETIQVFGKTRIPVKSFEKWYENQVHYKMVTGPPPGKNWQHTYSVQDIAEILGVHISTVYKLIKKENFTIYRVGMHRRIDKESFENWFDQSKYKRIKREDV